MNALDASVVIAAFATWHVSHHQARATLRDEPVLSAPCALEVYSVLTRLPAPHRVAGDVVRDLLMANFPDRIVALSADASAAVVRTLVERGVEGGASYDAVVALIASEAHATLVTLDRRACVTYERMGATWLVLG